eukprot:1292231-Pleurochrysis_carterae.AAC.1
MNHHHLRRATHADANLDQHVSRRPPITQPERVPQEAAEQPQCRAQRTYGRGRISAESEPRCREVEQQQHAKIFEFRHAECESERERAERCEERDRAEMRHISSIQHDPEQRGDERSREELAVGGWVR